MSDILNPAIIWPANPRALQIEEEGLPEVHIQILKEKKAVFWDSMPKRKKIYTSINGYIYFNGLVRYRCKVEEVINHHALLQRPLEHKYIPPFRRQCLLGEMDNGEPHPISQTWIKISKIEHLNPPLQISNIKRRNGQQLKAVVGGIVYIQDPIP